MPDNQTVYPFSTRSQNKRKGNLPPFQPQKPIQLTSFHRLELNQILSLYGKMVAKGDWKDYALDSGKETAVFSIFRRHGEHPIYRIVKNPKLAKRQGTYSIISATGQILKRGKDLSQVLKVFDRKLKKLSVIK